MDRSKSRGNVIKKLDFENCEVATVQRRRIYRKRLKARMLNEYEDDVMSISSGSSQNSCRQEGDVHSSPILFRKGSRQRTVPETPSPVLIGKQKSFVRVDKSQSPVVESSETTSPVFKFKSGSNNVKKSQVSQMSKPDKRKPSREIVTDDDNSAEECVIEEFSQEQSKDECKISNFSTESVFSSQVNISEDQSRETPSTADESFVFKTPTKTEDDMETIQGCDSGEKRKRYKKGGLVEKLLNLRKKHSSERRIREHRKKVMKTEEIWRRNLHVVEAWKDGTQLTLKCQQIEVSQDETLTDTGFLYVILNRDTGSLKKIKRGSFIRISAPWHEVRLHSLDATVLLAVSFIELIDPVPGVTLPKTRIQEVSVTKYKEDEALLFDTIFASDPDLLLH